MENETRAPAYYHPIPNGDYRGHSPPQYDMSSPYNNHQQQTQNSQTLPRSNSYGHQSTSPGQQGGFTDEYYNNYPTLKRRASAVSTVSSPATMNGYTSLDRRYSHQHMDSHFLRRISSWNTPTGTAMETTYDHHNNNNSSVQVYNQQNGSRYVKQAALNIALNMCGFTIGVMSEFR